MAEQPDLELIWKQRFGPQGYRYADASPVLRTVLDYALALEAQRDAAREALRRIEWAHSDPSDYPRPEWDSCFICDLDRGHGHAADCWLAAALGEGSAHG